MNPAVENKIQILKWIFAKKTDQEVVELCVEIIYLDIDRMAFNAIAQLEDHKAKKCLSSFGASIFKKPSDMTQEDKGMIKNLLKNYEEVQKEMDKECWGDQTEGLEA